MERIRIHGWVRALAPQPFVDLSYETIDTDSVMKITDDSRLETGWITATFEGYKVVAKVYDEPSDYGIDEGRVSKMSINKGGKCIFNYDRGKDFQDCPQKLVNNIVKQLEKLPKVHGV